MHRLSPFRIPEFVPRGGEREILLAIDHHAPRCAKRLGDSEDFSWWPGDNLCLEPAVFSTLASMQLPDDACGYPAKIFYNNS
jgi:hypothetical protein